MGFRRKIQTENAMLTLNTVTSKYKKMQKKVYTVFVDFAKFFDSIDHDLLFSKLRRIGIFGNLLCLLSNMYTNLEYSIKLPFKTTFVLTEPFSANIGLKQGCPLSPTLASIFLHDIHDEFMMHDMAIGDTKINSIAWADDVVFFSLTRSGLECQLKNLESYCLKWKLRVNVDKTKCMIFSSTSLAYDKENNFTFNGEIVMFVGIYKYLGIEFQQNGLFTTAIKNRISKAKSAFFMIKRACSTNENEYPSIELLLNLFQSKILPILTYGSSVWAPKSNNSIIGETNKYFQSNQHLLRKASLLNIKVKSIRSRKDDKTQVLAESYKEKLKFLLQKHTLGISPILDTYQDLYTLHESIERLHLSLLKKFLGVKKACSSDNVRFELGAYPIFSNYIPKAVKFYLASKFNSNPLIRTTINFAVTNESEWAQGIHFFLKTVGMETLMTQTSPPGTQNFKESAKKEIRGLYQRHLLSSNSKKFKNIKDELLQKYELRRYLKEIENSVHRSTLSKLRTHSHCLLEESHSYLGCSAVCKNCNSGSIETPLHFLLECDNNTLQKLRQPLIQKLKLNTNNLLTKYKDIMTGNIHPSEIFSTYKIIHTMYEKRQSNELLDEPTQDIPSGSGNSRGQ